jgi:hypothetical protein
MILYNNYIIITPHKTGTVSMNHTMYSIGAVILNEDVDCTLSGIEREYLKSKQINQKIDFDVYNAHLYDHSHIQVADKKIALMVRNPYERLVSWYYYFVVTGMDPHYHEGISFETFVLSLTEKKYKLSISLAELYNKVKADDYIRIENVGKDLKKLNITLSEHEIHHLNQNNNYRKKDIYKHFNSKILKHINPLVEEELKIFAYDIIPIK